MQRGCDLVQITKRVLALEEVLNITGIGKNVTCDHLN